jgi:hypothetical protein
MGFSWTKAALGSALLCVATKVTAASLPVDYRPGGGRGRKAPAFFLAGDSTTALDGGWGNGLLAPLIAPARGVNIGQSGATTASYIAAGNWTNITTHLKDYARTYDCYVTISVRNLSGGGGDERSG